MRQGELIVGAAHDTGLKPGTVAFTSHIAGLSGEEPLSFGLAGMVRYAMAYEERFGDKLATDGFLGAYFLDALKGLRGLLNGDGAVAMERGITTDSKDNGTCERLFWLAMEAAGFEESAV